MGHKPADAHSSATGAKAFTSARTALERVRHFFKGVRAAKRHPHVLVTPLLLLSTCLALGIWGCGRSAQRDADLARDQALIVAKSTAGSLSNVMSKALLPATMLAHEIFFTLNHSTVLGLFQQRAAVWWDDAPAGSKSLRVNAQGIVTAIYPPTPANLVYVTDAFDILKVPSLRQGSLATIAAQNATLTGPYMEESGYMIYIRIPIFANVSNENENWDMPDRCRPYNCPKGLCYNATSGTKWWGAAVMILDFNQLMAVQGDDGNAGPLTILAADTSTRYAVLRPATPGTDEPARVVVHGEGWDSRVGTTPDGDLVVPGSAECTALYVVGRVWWVCVWRDNWVPHYFKPLLGAVIVVSFLLSGLLFCMLLSRQQHKSLLASLVPKATLDMLKQQYNWSEERHGDGEAAQFVQQDTPAEAMLSIITAVLEKREPPVAEVLAVRAALHASADVYRPAAQDLAGRMAHVGNMDDEVQRALMAQLLGHRGSEAPRSSVAENVTSTGATGTRRLSLSEIVVHEEDEEGCLRLSVDGAAAAAEGHSSQKLAPSVGICPELAAAGHRAQAQKSPSLNQWNLPPAALDDTARPVVFPADQQAQATAPAGSHTDGQPTPSIGTGEAMTILTGGNRAQRDRGGAARPLPARTADLAGNVLLAYQSHKGFDNLAEAVATILEGAEEEEGGAAYELSCALPALDLHLHAAAEQAKLELKAQWSRASGTMHLGAPSSGLCDALHSTLLTAHQWSFDAFALCDVCHGRPLSVLAYWLMHTAGIISWGGLDAVKLARYLRAVEEGYPHNPYHNRIHAADVLQTLHVLMHRGGLVPGYVDSLTMLGAYLAAVVHDYEHRGRTNDFLVNAHDDLAVRYNDRSPMENHHLAAAFDLLRNPSLNFMSRMPRAQRDKLRKLIIELVLATDMKQHFSIMGSFSALHRLNTSAAPGQADANVRSTNTTNQTHGSCSPHTSTLPSGRGTASSNNSSLDPGLQLGSGGDTTNMLMQALLPVADNDKLLSLQMALKCADLGHLSAPLGVHLKWLSALEAEFFGQGDAERAAGLPISPLCDRTKQGVTKSQVGFFEFVVLPLFNNYVHRFTPAKPLLKAVMKNYKFWVAEAKRSEDATKAAAAVGQKAELPPTAALLAAAHEPHTHRTSAMSGTVGCPRASARRASIASHGDATATHGMRM